MRLINKITVHCTDSNHPSYGLEEIRKDHKAKGWKDIGYNYLITKTQIEIGRDINEIPAATKGHNTGSIAIAMAGRDNFSAGQFRDLKMLIKVLRGLFNIPAESIFNHYELNQHKTCPNFNVHTILDA